MLHQGLLKVITGLPLFLPNQTDLLPVRPRSIPGFDLYQAITECADLLESYGGHMYAAGITLKTENIQKFRDRFEEVVKNTVTPEMMIPQIEIDTELNFKDITPKMLRILETI